MGILLYSQGNWKFHLYSGRVILLGQAPVQVARLIQVIGILQVMKYSEVPFVKMSSIISEVH